MGLPRAIKKTIQKKKKKIYSKKIFKFKNFFTFQGLIHETNLITLGSSKIYKATQTLFFKLFFIFCSYYIYDDTDAFFLFLLQKDFDIVLDLFSPFVFFLFRTILISFTSYFPEPFFKFLIIFIYQFYIP